jgi:hypothetical protein
MYYQYDLAHNKGNMGHDATSDVPRPPRQGKMSGERRQSSGESGNVGEVEGASRDAERAAEELGDPIPGLPPPHIVSRRCVPGVCGHHTAQH